MAKFYVVWKGRNPGIFETWEACQAEISGFPNAQYKTFPNKILAEQAFLDQKNHYGLKKNQLFLDKNIENSNLNPKKNQEKNYILKSLAVDAACNPQGDLEYRGIWVETGALAFYQGVLKKGTNNIGEFLALVYALALLQKKQLFDYPIYTDSVTAKAWVRDKKHRSTIQDIGVELRNQLERAEIWLQTHQYKNPILKWETRVWGEIPADFGRKK